MKRNIWEFIVVSYKTTNKVYILIEELYKGKPIAYFETGMEGVSWCVELDKSIKGKGFIYDSIIPISTSDHLKVTSADGAVLFDSVIVKDIKSNRFLDMSGVSSRQVAGNYRCRWLQLGMVPELWANLFDDNNIAEVTLHSHEQSVVDDYIDKIPSYDSTRSKFEIIKNKYRIGIESEISPYSMSLIRSYPNDLNSDGSYYFNPDKYDSDMYVSLVIEQMMEDIKRWGDDVILITSKNTVPVLSHSHYSDEISNEDFEELIGSNYINSFSIEDYLPGDFFQKDTLLSDEELAMLYSANDRKNNDFFAHFNQVKESWKWFTYIDEGCVIKAALVKIRK